MSSEKQPHNWNKWEKNLLLSLDIRLRATHTHKYAESNFIDLTHKWKKIIYVCNLEKTILNCTNEKEKWLRMETVVANITRMHDRCDPTARKRKQNCISRQG